MKIEQLLEVIKNDENFVNPEIVEGTFIHCTTSWKLDKIMATNELLGAPINENLYATTKELTKDGVIFASEEADYDYGNREIEITGKAIKVTHFYTDTVEFIIPVNLIEKWEVVGGY